MAATSRSKQALLDAIADRVVADAEMDVPAGDPWQDVASTALAVRQAVLAHPRLVPLLATSPPLGPAAQRVVERLLSSLTEAGLPPHEAAQALQLLVTVTLGTLTNATRADRVLGRSRHHEVTRALRASPDENPLAADLARLFMQNDDAGHFAFAIDVVLVGLRQRVIHN